MRMPAVIRILPLLLFLIIHSSIKLSGQTTLAILPVSTNTAGVSLLSDEQWRGIALNLQDYITESMAQAGIVTELSREHLMLLLKEMQPANSDNLSREAYQRISRNENLDYFLKVSIQSIQEKDMMIMVSGDILVIEGTSGTKFWDKKLSREKKLNVAEITEAVLVSEVLKPMLDPALDEALKLNY